MCSLKNEADKLHADSLAQLSRKSFTFEMAPSLLDKELAPGSPLPPVLALSQDSSTRINPLAASAKHKHKKVCHDDDDTENDDDQVNHLIDAFYSYSKANLLKFSLEVVNSSERRKNASPAALTNKSASLRSSPRLLSPNKSLIDAKGADEAKRLKRSITNPSFYTDAQHSYGFKSDRLKPNETKPSLSSLDIFYQFNLNETEKANSTAKASKAKTNTNVNSAHNIVTQMSSSLAENSSLDLFTCPFCCLNCKYLISLIKHLDNCHFRFKIKFNLTNQATGKGSGSLTSQVSSSNLSQQYNDNKSDMISLNDNTNLNLVNGGYSSGLNGLNVGFNASNNLSNSNINNYLNIRSGKVKFEINYDEIYDGSYLGNPYDWQNAAHLGYSKSRIKPTKRVSVTYVIVNK